MKRIFTLIRCDALVLFAGCSGVDIDYENLTEVSTTQHSSKSVLGEDVNADSVTLSTALQSACEYMGWDRTQVSFSFNGVTTVENASCESYTIYDTQGASFIMAVNTAKGAVYVSDGGAFKLVTSR